MSRIATYSLNAIFQLSESSADYLCEYIEFAAVCESAVPSNDKVKKYVEGLLLHGGPATDVFKKCMGEDKTKEVFEKIVFGVNRENNL